ncbi:MAG: aspartate/glutamate racemase family protein, partial [Betaproteobacteria bacterium]
MSKHRIWFQGATDRAHMAPYIARVEAHFKAILDADFTFSFNTTTPPATTTHALTEYRVGRNFIRNAIQAEKERYDVVAVTHFQDPGLSEAKSAVGIPVLGLGETTLHFCLTLGRKLGLVTINPAFIPWHEDQIIKYGMTQRVVGVRAVNANVLDYIAAFSEKAALDKLMTLWERECRALLDAGADVIVPAGGIPMMLFGGAPGANIDGAPIVNGMSVIAKAAEMAVKLKRDCGIAVSRRSNFA